ncbi:septation protein SepH [Actinoallomurus sp. NBC_01490]|uniref:septation protein SepH n=1 Tax=Actinoallomurus sp. NBC_01490 TaxID=2903557 RepID=UPI002E2F4BBB|nr:septation protein SepH [Actinoallomurus sp. NBC_01490]
MQELRLVAVSEDGSYLVLATAGRGTRFTLPVDDRLRAAVRGHFSRLGQYEIEVESPLRPKEIQARIRAGETAEEIAETAGIPVERVRWFEGPVLQEREYMAQQAQRVTIRRQGESAPAPALGEIVEERLGKRGIDLEEVEWDSRKCEDSTWRVRLSFSYDGRPYAAEWAYDPRRRHISAVNEEAARLSSLELDDPVDDIVTPFVPRRAMKVVTEPVREEAPPAPVPAPAPAPREEPPVAEEPAFVREVPRQEVPRPEPEEPRETGLSRAPSQRETAPAREETAPREVTPREAVPPSPQETQRETAREAAPPSSPAEPRETTPARPRETDPAEPRESAAAAPQAPPAEEPTPAPRPSRGEPARPAAKREPAVRKPASKPAEPKAAPQKPAARGPAQPKPSAPKPAPPKQPKPAEAPAAETTTEQPAAAAAAGGGKATPPPAQEKRPARKKSRSKRASVPSWDEIMFGARRPE